MSRHSNQNITRAWDSLVLVKHIVKKQNPDLPRMFPSPKTRGNITRAWDSSVFDSEVMLECYTK